MSRETFNERFKENVPGRIYVDTQCTDCGYCREIAPDHFTLQQEGLYSYVSRQPKTGKEEASAQEAITGCPCAAIHSDGDEFA